MSDQTQNIEEILTGILCDNWLCKMEHECKWCTKYHLNENIVIEHIGRM